jgi:hypothetical protein
MRRVSLGKLHAILLPVALAFLMSVSCKPSLAKGAQEFIPIEALTAAFGRICIDAREELILRMKDQPNLPGLLDWVRDTVCTEKSSIYAKVHDLEAITNTNNYISNIGIDAFIKEMRRTLVENHKRFRIGELEQMVSDGEAIDGKVIKFFFVYTESTSKYEALMKTAQDYKRTHQ